MLPKHVMLPLVAKVMHVCKPPASTNATSDANCDSVGAVVDAEPLPS